MYSVCTDWTEQKYVAESELDDEVRKTQQQQFDSTYMTECYMVADRFNLFLAKFDQLDQDSWYLTDDGFIIPAGNQMTDESEDSNKLEDLIAIQELAHNEGFQLKLKVSN